MNRIKQSCMLFSSRSPDAAGNIRCVDLYAGGGNLLVLRDRNEDLARTNVILLKQQYRYS